jgi:DnaK suppressor protein
MKNKIKTVKKAETRKPLFPQNLLVPIGVFLKQNLERLTQSRRKIDKEDPFKNALRVSDNAAPDTEAEEQFGHARTQAIKKELNNKIEQTKQALKRLEKGKYGVCEDCGKMIDTDRLSVYPEAAFCTSCQIKREK